MPGVRGPLRVAPARRASAVDTLSPLQKAGVQGDFGRKYSKTLTALQRVGRQEGGVLRLGKARKGSLRKVVDF